MNEPEMGQIEVISLSAKKVVKAWNLKAALQNTPMAIDRKNKRLFIACDTGKFIILSTTSGQEIQRIVIHKNADGIYYDGKRKLLYVSCGEGFIDVIRQQNANHYQIEGTIPTTKGAATSLFSPSTDNYYLAIPQSANTPAEIRIYKPLHS
ncbi:YncE family protein [Puia sp. P3]|uniref:YncE family protein n=1 Tax=Puia sp. P3 TaxID=3423952 RepID=UPI003D67EAA9